MTEIWPSPRLASVGRELFSAFVCDDQSVQQMRAVCHSLGWSLDHVNKGGLKNAIETLSVSSSPCILFIDLSETPEPLRDINALAEVCEPGTIVIAGGQMNDVRLYRDLVASGIQDYILKPFNPEQLRESLSHAQTILMAPRSSDESEIPHFQVGVIGVRGGVGASVIAGSLAWTLAANERRATALLDLDIHFGTGALGFDLEPGRGLTEAIENPARIDGLFLERALVQASDKLSVLAAETSILQPVLSDGTAFRMLQDELKTGYECTVTDMPRDTGVFYPHLLSDMRTALLVAEPNLACARDMFRMITWLKGTAPHVMPFVVLNKLPAGNLAEISRADFEKAIEQKVDLALPEDFKTVRHCARLGKAVTDAGKSSKLGTALIELGSELVNLSGTTPSQEVAEGPNHGGLSSLFRKFTTRRPQTGARGKTGYVPG